MYLDWVKAIESAIMLDVRLVGGPLPGRIIPRRLQVIGRLQSASLPVQTLSWRGADIKYLSYLSDWTRQGQVNPESRTQPLAGVGHPRVSVLPESASATLFFMSLQAGRRRMTDYLRG